MLWNVVHSTAAWAHDHLTHLACVQGGANADAEDGGGQKPIHAAAAEQHRHVVEALLPLTQPDADSASNWTVDSIIEEAQQSIAVDQPQIMQHQVGRCASLKARPASFDEGRRQSVQLSAAAAA